MKKYLKLIIPAALLLITASAFAQVNKEFDDFQKQSQATFDSVSNDARNQFSDSSKNAKAGFDDFAKQVNSAKQEQEKAKLQQNNGPFQVKKIESKKYDHPVEYANPADRPQDEQDGSPYPVQKMTAPNYDTTPENFPCKDNDIDCVCGDNKYCQTHAKIMKRLTKWTVVVTNLKDKENHKQYLYEEKWKLTNQINRSDLVAEIEKSEIQELYSFKKIQDYITDMPLTKEAFRFALRRMQLYTKDSQKEEGVFIQALGKAVEKSEDCPKNLSVNNYGLDNFCTLP